MYSLGNNIAMLLSYNFSYIDRFSGTYVPLPNALMINARLLILLEAGNWIAAVTVEGGMSL